MALFFLLSFMTIVNILTPMDSLPLFFFMSILYFSLFHYLSIISQLWTICSYFMINVTTGEEPPVPAVPAEVLQAEHAQAPPRLAREGKGTSNPQDFCL